MNLETALARKIYETLQAAGGEWLTRQDIAARMGRKHRLPPYDREILDAFVQRGDVERQTRVRKVVQTEFIYRIRTAQD